MDNPPGTDTFKAWYSALVERTDALDRVVESHRARLSVEDTGGILRVDGGIAEVSGLPGVSSEELVRFPEGRLGMAYDLGPDRLGVILVDAMGGLSAGDMVRRTGEVMSAPVGERLLGRVVDAAGRTLDGKGALVGGERWPIERPAASIMDRASVDTPLQTGVKVIDALLPIGRGQRQLILGDRQTGKTSLAVDIIINQRREDVVCIYCAVGIRRSAVAKVVAELSERGALDHAVVVVATGDDPPGLQYIAPYAATTLAEFFMEAGSDVLVVYDDLTRHARAYRELSLLLRRPPGREAYPGDIFYVHSRLLERPTNLRRGGSLTALPIVETEAQNISAYIPTNLISITDGQIYLSPRLFQQGVLPAVDVGRSVSRVGGRAQLPAYHSVAGDLRLSYAQFEELERFSRYGARLEPDRERQLERGRRVREVLKQPPYSPLPVDHQLAILAAVVGGAFDETEVSEVATLSGRVAADIVALMPELFRRLSGGERFSKEDLAEVQRLALALVEEKT